MIIDHGMIHTGKYAGQTWEIKRRRIPGAASYELTVGGEFYASGDSVADLMDDLDEISW